MPDLTPAPVLIHRSCQTHHLRRLSRFHTEFDEKFLQELLVDHPDLFPVSKLRDDVGQLLCVGREVPVGGSGAIDNLYLSTGGYPVVVETKLWRNPQARREVLSQVLDYTKELVKKDFEWFERLWGEFSGKRFGKDGSLMAKLDERADEELDEAVFVDRVNRALKKGDILSLIVGDGIESRLRELVSHLCENSAHLRYTLALVELACYHMEREEGKEDILVVPRIIQEVEPVQRAYVRIEMAPELEAKTEVKSEVQAEEGKRPGYVRTILTEEEFLKSLDESVGVSVRQKVEEFYRGLTERLELETEVKSSTITLKVPDPNGEKPSVSLLAITRQGGVYNTRHIRRQLRNMGLPEEMVKSLVADYWKSLNRVDNRFSVDGISHMASTQFLPIKDLMPKLSQIEQEVSMVVIRIREQLGDSI